MDNNLSQTREFIIFNIGHVECCVDIMSVREIRGWTKATPLPYAQNYVCGVINLRGAVLSIIDLAVRMGFQPTEASARHVIIVVQIADQVAGLLVDAVTGILATDQAKIMPTPDIAPGMARELIAGVLAIDDRMINIVGLEYILPRAVGAAA